MLAQTERGLPDSMQIISCIDDTLAVLVARLKAKQPMYQPDAEWNALMKTCESLRAMKQGIHEIYGKLRAAKQNIHEIYGKLRAAKQNIYEIYGNVEGERPAQTREKEKQ